MIRAGAIAAFDAWAAAREAQIRRWFVLAVETRGAEFALTKQAEWLAHQRMDIHELRLKIRLGSEL